MHVERSRGVAYRRVGAWCCILRQVGRVVSVQGSHGDALRDVAAEKWKHRRYARLIVAAKVYAAALFSPPRRGGGCSGDVDVVIRSLRHLDAAGRHLSAKRLGCAVQPRRQARSAGASRAWVGFVPSRARALGWHVCAARCVLHVAKG